MQASPIQNPPRPTPIPVQPISNLNNRPTQPVKKLEVQNIPTYVINPAPFNRIELRLGRVVNKTNPDVVIQEEEQVDSHTVQEEEQVDNHTDQEEEPIDIQIVQREEQMVNQLNEEKPLYNKKLILPIPMQQKHLKKQTLLLVHKGYL
jgi:hypothetical protein